MDNRHQGKQDATQLAEPVREHPGVVGDVRPGPDEQTRIKDTKSMIVKKAPDEESKKLGKGTDTEHEKEARSTRDSEKSPV